MKQGRKKSQYNCALPRWPLLQATGNLSHWDLLESLMKCVSQLSIWVTKVVSSHPSSSSPFCARVAPWILSASYFQVAHALVQNFQGDPMPRQQRSPSARSRLRKVQAQTRCAQVLRVQKRSTGPTWVGCSPLECSRILHRGSRLVGNCQGRPKIFLTRPFVSVTVFT